MNRSRTVGVGLLAVSLLALINLPQLQPTWVALAQQIRSYGSDGRNGRDGRDGDNGRPGEAQTLWLDGTPQRVNGAGGDGGDGESGEPGERAYCPAQPSQVRYDLQAADGGDGGDGGNGGSGGQGGDITLYFADVAHLQQVFVDTPGGRSGRAGRGGRGGDACRCYQRQWYVQTCTNGSCRQERFICRDGNLGGSGLDGNEGVEGKPGQLWLIPQLEPLPPETPTLTQSLATLLQGPAQLSKNIWQTRTGAKSLLANGSVVDDTYQQYVERIEGRFQILWQADRPQQSFLSIAPTLTLDSSGHLQVEFPPSVWVEGSRDRKGPLTTYAIHQIVNADAVTQLAWGSQQGRGSDFALHVIDLGQESPFVATQFELIYGTANDDPRNNRRIRYRTRYQGPLPSNLISRNNNRFHLALGQLPVDPSHFQPGTQAQIKLQITRSLGIHATTHTLEWQGKL